MEYIIVDNSDNKKTPKKLRKNKPKVFKKINERHSVKNIKPQKMSTVAYGLTTIALKKSRGIKLPTRTIRSILRELLTKGFKPTKEKIGKELLKELSELAKLRKIDPSKIMEAQKHEVVLRSGPFAGEVRKIHRDIDLFSEDLMYFVVSSNLLAIGYDKEKKQMQIEFKNGGVYTYYNVPPNVFKGLKSAGSHGEYFWKHIRKNFGKYPYRRLRFHRPADKIPEAI